LGESSAAPVSDGLQGGNFAEGDSSPSPTRNDSFLDPFSVSRVTAPRRGALSAPGEPRPQLPDELAGKLSPQEHFLAWRLVAGDSWPSALDQAGVPPRATLRDAGPPEHVREAAEWLVQAVAEGCGLSRRWLLAQWVALYRRAAAAEPVLDRQGRPTGDYRFDGATAAKALTALGNEATPGRGGDPRYSADQVAELLRAIAARGKPSLEARRELVVGGSSSSSARLAGPGAGRGAAPDEEKA
jgi:hypothetical protein